MKEQYECLCGSKIFEIRADSVCCVKCNTEYRIGIEISPARFNSDRHKVIVVAPIEENLKTGRKF